MGRCGGERQPGSTRTSGPTRASRHDDAALPRQCFRAANTAGRSLRSSLESHHGSPTVCRCRCAIHAQGRRVALLAFPGPRSMAMHNPRFPRIRPLALSLLLACGAGASLPAVAGITCVVEHSERSEEHTSELQSLMRISYAVFCLKKKKNED